MIKKWIFILLLSSMSLQGLAQTDVEDTYGDLADQILSEALTYKVGYNWMREFCDIGARYPGSGNLEKAIEWTRRKMESLELDTVWEQKVMIPHWKRGKAGLRVINSIHHNGDELTIAALGRSLPTDGIISGEVVEVTSFDELDSLAEQVKDKIVFYNVLFDHAKPFTFDAYGKSVQYRVFGASRAAQYGAIAVLVRTITSKPDDEPHHGTLYYEEDKPKIPGATITVKDAENLHAMLTKEPDIILEMYLDCETLPDMESSNVIGEIKGSKYPDEIIVIGGHIDSWDAGDGAHDDAAGCLQTIEVMQLMKKLDIKPSRTIRCVMFVNEEAGISGGKVYGAYADSVNEKHVVALESDAGAFTPRGFFVKTDSTTLLQMQEWLPVLRKASIEWIEDGHTGVDMRFINNLTVSASYMPDCQRYFDYHHSANDVFSAIHPREFEMSTAAIAIYTLLLSEELVTEK